MIQFDYLAYFFQSGVGGKKNPPPWKHICEAPGVDQRPSTSTAKRGCWRHQVCPCHEWKECFYFYPEKCTDLSTWKGRDQGTSDYTFWRKSTLFSTMCFKRWYVSTFAVRMMKTDDFLVLQKDFGSLGFVHKLEYLSGARDIKGYVLLCEAIL